VKSYYKECSDTSDQLGLFEQTAGAHWDLEVVGLQLCKYGAHCNINKPLFQINSQKGV